MRVLFELSCTLNFGEYVNNMLFLRRAHAKKICFVRRKIAKENYTDGLFDGSNFRVELRRIVHIPSDFRGIFRRLT